MSTRLHRGLCWLIGVRWPVEPARRIRVANCGRARFACGTVRGDPAGQFAEQVLVNPAGDDRDEGRVALVAWSGGRVDRLRGTGLGGTASGRIGLLGLRGLLAEQIAQRHVQLNLRGLACAVRYAAGGDQAAACLLEGVVMALRDCPVVLGACPLAERVEDCLHGGGAARGKVAVQPAGPSEGGSQTQSPLVEPIVVPVGRGETAVHLLGERRKIAQVGAVCCGREQDCVGVVPGALGEQVGPVADLAAPGGRQIASTEGGGYRPVRLQAAH